LGSLSSLLLFGILFSLLFDCVSNYVNVVDFKVSQSLDFSEVPSTSYYGVKPIQLTGFKVEKRAGPLVEKISFNATYVDIGEVRAPDLIYGSNLIIAYMKVVSGKGKKRVRNYILAPSVMWIPYSSKHTAPRWFVESVYNEVIEPLDLESESGAWNSGETLLIVVEFARDDRPYFDPTDGVGFFYILLDLPTGACGVMAVK